MPISFKPIRMPSIDINPNTQKALVQAVKAGKSAEVAALWKGIAAKQSNPEAAKGAAANVRYWTAEAAKTGLKLDKKV